MVTLTSADAGVMNIINPIIIRGVALKVLIESKNLTFPEIIRN
jgi:hypothetical protein